MPSRKVISILIICIALVTSIILIFNPKIPGAVGTTSSLSGTLKSGVAVNFKSTDSSDWQKQVSDLSINPSTVKTSGTASSSETLTDQFSRTFMANYLSMKQANSGNALDNTSATNLISQAENFIDTTSNPSFALKDIVVSSDNSKAAISKYGNDLGLAFKINKPKGEAQNEMALFVQLMQNNDSSAALAMRNIADIYKNTVISLSRITVPSSFTADHLKMLNLLNNISLGVSDMAVGQEDPLRALRGMQMYTNSFKVLYQPMSNIRLGILRDGVNYKQGDNGYFFYFGI